MVEHDKRRPKSIRRTIKKKIKFNNFIEYGNISQKESTMKFKKHQVETLKRKLWRNFLDRLKKDIKRLTVRFR